MLPVIPPPPGGKPKRGRGRPPGAKNRKSSGCSSNDLNLRGMKTAPSKVEKRTGKTKVASLEKPLLPLPSATTTTKLAASTIEFGDNAIINNHNDVCMKDSSVAGSPNMNEFHQNTQDGGNVLRKCHQSVSEAMATIRRLEHLTKNQPQLLQTFMELLEDYRSFKIDIGTFSAAVVSKFSAYPDFLLWFNELIREDALVKGTFQVKESNFNAMFSHLPWKSDETDTNKNPTINAVEKIVNLGCPEQNQHLLELPTPGIGPHMQKISATPTSSIRSLQSTNDVSEGQSWDGMISMALLSIDVLQRVKSRLIMEPQKYEKVSNALSALYELRENLNSNNYTDRQSTFELSEQQRSCAYGVIRDILKDDPDLMEVVEAIFKSKMTYPGLPSCATAPAATTTKSPLEQNVTDLNSAQSSMNRFPALSLLAETSTQSDCYSAVEITNMVLPPGLIWSSSKVKDLSMFSNVLLGTSTQQEVLSLSNQAFKAFQNPFVSFEENRRRWLQFQRDEQKWSDEFVNALGPILLKRERLCEFLSLYLGSEIIISNDYLDANEESEHDPTRKNPFADTTAVTEMDTYCETYKTHLSTTILPKCSGRTQLCNDVLNDTYYSVTRHIKFGPNFRTKEEEMLDDYEDARYEMDMMLYRNSRTIEIFENLNHEMSKLENARLDYVQLDDSLGGSSIIHRRSVQLHYKNDGKLVIDRLQNFPALFIPGILKNIKVRDKEWIEMKARWNSLISDELRKCIAEKSKRNGGTKHRWSKMV